MPCPFYCETAEGRRCVLMSPEEFRVWSSKYGTRMCEVGYTRCLLYNKVIHLTKQSSVGE
ncbi:MAG: metal-binding protein [Thermoprotei archaeon]|nr:MAG: metal-binding protein [Thermoprotei archaeon]